MKTDADVWLEMKEALKRADAKISRLEAALAECREYFADRADADNMNTDPEPNAEMTLLTMIDRVLIGGEV